MRKILVYHNRKIKLPDVNVEAVIRSEEHYLFVLSLTSYTKSDGSKHVSYVFLKKKVNTVMELIQESLNSEKKSFRFNSLMKEDQEVDVLVPGM